MMLHTIFIIASIVTSGEVVLKQISNVSPTATGSLLVLNSTASHWKASTKGPEVCGHVGGSDGDAEGLGVGGYDGNDDGVGVGGYDGDVEGLGVCEGVGLSVGLSVGGL